ncbi:MAG: metal-dependent transcriptional regulator [Deltaproteobacteria bacterium]|nr:metal-dependent transcriptional regulator [Deltaproteobacteria bacterium]
MDVWKEFHENEITHSGAHHLLAILELIQTRGYARVSDVAKCLSITTGSASTNLKSLKQKGYVEEDDNKFLLLTAEGRALSEAILSRRKILISFLTEILGVSPTQAEIDSCKTEHLFSQETTTKMQQFAGRHQRAKQD